MRPPFLFITKANYPFTQDLYLTSTSRKMLASNLLLFSHPLVSSLARWNSPCARTARYPHPARCQVAEPSSVLVLSALKEINMVLDRVNFQRTVWDQRFFRERSHQHDCRSYPPQSPIFKDYDPYSRSLPRHQRSSNFHPAYIRHRRPYFSCHSFLPLLGPSSSRSRGHLMATHINDCHRTSFSWPRIQLTLSIHWSCRPSSIGKSQITHQHRTCGRLTR